MNLRRSILCLALIAALASGSAWGVDEEAKPGRRGPAGAPPLPGNSKNPPMPGQSGRGGAEKMLESLSEEDRQKLRSAVAAVWGDPGVMNARKKMAEAGEELKVALREAIEKEDPEVREILKKMLAHGDENGGHRFGPGFRGKPLSAEDRKIMDEARAKALELDEVIAARDKRENAETMAEKFTASREFQEIIYKEMVKMDPRVEKILSKRVRGGGDRMRSGQGGKGDGSKGPGKRPRSGNESETEEGTESDGE